MAAEQLKPLNGLDKVRKWVENHGLKRAAVTNAPRPNAELMLSILGLSDFFDAVIIGGECEHAKPHPDPYLKGLEALKASKDHTFVFEVCFFMPFYRIYSGSGSEAPFLCLRILFQESKLEWQLGCLL